MTLPVQKIDLSGTYTVRETAEILQTHRRQGIRPHPHWDNCPS